MPPLVYTIPRRKIKVNIYFFYNWLKLKDKIKKFIGKRGNFIKSWKGSIKRIGTDQEGIDAVLSNIESMLFKPEVGSVYEVKVIKILDFGAVVEHFFWGGVDRKRWVDSFASPRKKSGPWEVGGWFGTKPHWHR